MSKERFLTVMVPIKDSDCEPTVYASLSALQSAVTPSSANTNKIYKVADGTYYRSLRDASSGVFSYNEVTEREFPYLGDPLTIYDFTYDATRMGTAPTISAQNVMRYAEKNGTDDVTLEGLWTQECHVVFNGERFYLKRIPTSSKTNEDARYKYDLDFVAETICLENVYFYDIEAPFATGKPVSENSTFSFFGGIEDLVNRINANFIMSGLAFLVRKHVNYENHPSIEVPYLTYSQWNQVNVYPASLVPSIFETSWYATLFLTEIYNPLNGDYNRYLMQYIYVNDNGDYEVNGYKCVIGKDKMGETASSEEKLVSFDDNTIHEALRQFHDTFECDYYIAREKDSNDIFTGNTLIVVGDCEHDFADWDDETEDYVRDANGLPMTESPFDYGATNELLSKEKTNTTDKIVTRITGVGSSENIPWHYPNPTPDGWIKPMFLTKGVVKPSVTIDYPTDEGSTAEDYARYEKYLKNRIGKMFSWGSEKGFHTASEYAELHDNIVVIIGGETYRGFYVDYEIQKNKILNPRITFSMYYPLDSGCYGFSADLLDAHGDTVDSYSSWVEYQNPTAFQTMCLNRNSFDMTELMQSPPYTFRLEFLFESIPSSETYDYEGYLYPSAFFPIGYHGRKAYIGQNFYQQQNLLPYVNYTIGESYIYIYDAGYSTNGLPSGKVEPIPRVDGKKYKDVANNKVHVCTTSSACNVTTGQFKDAFTERASMTWEEWISTFLSMRLRLFESNGWYLQNKSVALSDYGLGTPMHGESAYTPDIFDTIDFRMVKWLSPKSNIMPEVYVKTDGEHRFYEAHNYWDSDNGSLYLGTADAAIGEEQVDAYVRNPIYKEKETDEDSKHYMFENEYVQKLPHEHIENFDDLKPTIKEQRNTVGGEQIRIDVVEVFDYDLTDNDEIWESSDGNGTQGEYKHPYFFAKLRPMGFNIFDLALQEDMVLSMTTGDCGACNFKIGVDENTKKNPVQIWEYDVYEGGWSSKVLKYSQGSLRRYVDMTGLYYDTNGQENGYVLVSSTIGNESGGQMEGEMYVSYAYSAEDVANGFVGTTKKKASAHFEGDVVTSGRFIESQQDTSENYVWVALMKDTETYGVLMPSAKPNHNNQSYSTYIRPKSIADVHDGASTVEEDEENADKFVLLNISLPQIYLRRAERKLSHQLVRYMYEHNAQKFNFQTKFSRIYLAENNQVDDNLNENSVVYVLFNGKTYRQYVKHYTYRMSHDSSLPEITIDANDELPVTMTILQKQEKSIKDATRQFYGGVSAIEQKMKESASGTTEYVTTINKQNLEWEDF